MGGRWPATDIEAPPNFRHPSPTLEDVPMVEASSESVRPRFINVGTIVMLVVMVVGGFWLRPVMATRNLNSLVASTNADLPRTLDAGTRLDRLSGSSEGVVYHLTVLNEVDFAEVRPRLEAQTRTAYCESMEGVVNDGFSAEWRYSTQEGRSLGSVKHEPSECR